MTCSHMPPAHPFDDDKLREECGVFGILGVTDAANFVALGLHALQHRGQEAGGIVAYDETNGFNSARRFGYVRDNFTSQSLMKTLPVRVVDWTRALFNCWIKGSGHSGRPTFFWRICYGRRSDCA